MTKRLSLIALLVITMLLILAACGQKPGRQETSKQSETGTSDARLKSSFVEPIELRWGTTTAGGAWQVIGNAMLEDIKRENTNITGSCVPSTTTANVLGVHEGKYNVGFSLTDTTADAWNGEGFFKETGKIQDIREVAALYPHASCIVVGTDSGIDSIADLKGKKVSPGAKGLSSDLELQRLLKLYGMSYNDMQVQFLSFNDAAQQFIDGHLDCLAFVTVPQPFAPIINVASQREIKILSIPDEKIAEMEKFQGVKGYTLPPNTYPGIDYPVKGITVRSHIFVREDMPEEVVYKIVKTIVDNFDRYGDVLSSMKFVVREELAADVGIPFHPGALKYYKEKGWLK